MKALSVFKHVQKTETIKDELCWMHNWTEVKVFSVRCWMDRVVELEGLGLVMPSIAKIGADHAGKVSTLKEIMYKIK